MQPPFQIYVHTSAHRVVRRPDARFLNVMFSTANACRIAGCFTINLRFEVFSLFYPSSFVEFIGIVDNWLCLKPSQIQNSGLGVFAQREFCEKEFVTAYLGKIELNHLETEYVFQNINGKVECKFGCLREEFWFTHRMQYGSGPTANIKIKVTIH
jgi:hypothetical protein